MEHIDCDVAVVGAGPVGLTLAMWLADGGVDVVVLERRAAREAPPVKCNHISARSMEVFRRLGVASALRAAGLPDEHSHDVAFRTSMVGEDFGRIPIAGRAGRTRGDRSVDDWWPTPEPPHRVNQLFMEPILFDHASTRAKLRLVNEVDVVSLREHGDRVVVSAQHRDGPFEIAASYAVGADGGRSTVRRLIDVEMSGDAVVQRVQSTHIDAPGLGEQFQDAPAWATVVLNHSRSGTAYAIDGASRWLIHNYLRPDEADFESIDRDWAIRAITGVPDLEYQLVSKEDWFGRRLIADRFRVGRTFLCGDAAHIWVPYAGYGMNAGIADAADLAWLLVAVITGWGSPSMLDAYELERWPITEQVSRHAMDHAEKMIANREAVPALIDDPTEAGRAVRERYGRSMADLNVAQYACAGLNFGSFYDRSPIVVADGDAPAYTMGEFTPSSVPGCRVPHFFDDVGRSVLDHLGDDYLIVGVSSSAESVDRGVRSAHAAGVPARGLIAPDTADVLWDGTLIVRPDGHVAWRGSVAADDDVWNRLAGRPF